MCGGALCASRAEHSGEDLRRIAAEITGPNVLVANDDLRAQRVNVDVYVPDDGLQADFDDRYGEGVVRLVPWLRPVSP